jgi:hypothetical protein
MSHTNGNGPDTHGGAAIGEVACCTECGEEREVEYSNGPHIAVCEECYPAYMAQLLEGVEQYEQGQIDDKYWQLKRRDYVEERTGGNGPDPARYRGRHVDLRPLLAAPVRPIPWRVEGLVADGTVTILSGESGSGKSWVAQGCCTGVERGTAVAGLPCAQGRALYVDAEMGPAMFVDQRLRPAGATEPEFEYIDGMGLDISKPNDLAWLRDKIEETGANLVVFDSLRRLTPSKAENDSDDMAPVVGAIAKLARDTGAAILLVHHKGDGEKFSRGSTAIKDQADALFGLLRESEDEILRPAAAMPGRQGEDALRGRARGRAPDHLAVRWWRGRVRGARADALNSRADARLREGPDP